ncbi:MAG TPA: DNA translocase FtsK 4TM domain-containing protein [Candidatus Sulfotelmatobacter sp.]|jgi:S-DNA-T family DNA segregation ATPase FtsK/SpoIIIE|nr:DNA translocase FtsK 4TM domain-containing protein [Candidatus Sulfotelmatobacter sp.]
MATGPQTRKKKKSGGFLPEGMSALFTRWAWQAAGVGVVGLALVLAAALATYHPKDHSFNTAADPTWSTQNMGGLGGAFISDVLLQLVGIAAWLPPIALLLWGGRLMVGGRPMEKLWLRGLLLLSGLLLVAIGLAAVPVPPQMHLPGAGGRHLGGSAGTLLLEGLTSTLTLFGADSFGWVMALLSGALGTVCTVTSLGLSWQEWRTVGRSLRNTFRSWNETREKLAALPDAIRAMFARQPAFAGAEQPMSHEPVRREPNLRPEPPIKTPTRKEPSLFAPTYIAEEEPEDDFDEPLPPLERPEPLVAPRAPRTQPGKRAQAQAQGKLQLPDEDPYELPPPQLLTEPPPAKGYGINQESLEQNARLLESVLEDFGVNGNIVKVRPGPVVTLYELEPAAGTKTSRVIGLADDIARSMSALSVRIATVPGRNVIGIELPNTKRETVFLRELLDSEAFERAPSRLTLVLGKDIGGQPVMVDLARMPHLLIAGTTGSGKSVAINTMILSLLYKLKPEECRMIMIDPKMLELSVYDGIPHLLAPVVTEPGKAVVALKWAVREMEDRYRAMSQLGVRNITGYNQRLVEARHKGESLSRTVQTGFDPDTGKPIYEDQPLALEPLPFIVIVVDEMADLMLVAGKDVEGAVQRLAQMARAAGIHIIMATQRPSVDVITGTIKANFPSRISFQVSSKIDSRTILGEQGAEQLLGQGDMLYMAAGGRITRVHGPFVSDQEVEGVVEHLRQQGEPAYLESVTEEDNFDPDMAAGGAGGSSSGDSLYDQAVAIVAREGKASTSFIQRHLQIGYNKAAGIIDRMEREGVVSKANHVGKREVLVGHHGD